MTYLDVLTVYICDNCGWMTPQPDGRTASWVAWDALGEDKPTVKRGLADCSRCKP